MTLHITHSSKKSTSKGEYSDLQIWNELKNGSKTAFELVYEAHVKPLFDYGCKLSGNREIVEDCIQDLFITIWQRRNELQVTSSIRYYLISSIRRGIINKLQKSAKTEPLPDPFYLTVLENEGVESDDRLRIVKATIAKLPRRQKEAIDLKFFHNLDYDEIADVMGIAVESSYNLISKAVNSLKIKVRDRNQI